MGISSSQKFGSLKACRTLKKKKGWGEGRRKEGRGVSMVGENELALGAGGRGLQITSRPALITEYLIALTWASLAPDKGRAGRAYLVCNHSLNHFFVAPKQWDLGAKANNFCAGRVSSPSLIFPPSGPGTHGVICAEIGSWLTPTMSYPLGGPREGETRDTWGELCFPVADL